MADHRMRPLTFALAATSMLALSTAASAQMQGQQQNENTFDVGDWSFTVNLAGGGEYQFDADIDNDAEFDVARARIGLSATSDISNELSLSLKAGYQYSDYSFSGETGFAVLDPWDDVHTIAFSAMLTYDIEHDWSIFGGPFVTFSREDSADWGDSFAPGGVIGARWQVNESFSLGLGLGILAELEDNTTIFPYISVEWEINDQWSLRSSSPAAAGTLPGLELVYECGGGWEFAVGGTYEYHRFRLEDSGFAPDGVGQDTSVPIWLRASYETGENFSIGVLGGVKLGGELAIDDSDGDELADEDFDSAPFVGLFASYRF